MTLDEAIAHAREVARKNRDEYEFECSYFGKETVDNGEKLDCVRCAEEHEQLVEWLEELNELRNMTAGHLYAVAFNRGYLKVEKEVREKAIEDFEIKLTTHFADWKLSNTPCNDDETDRTKEIICETIENAIGTVEEIAEQLKESEAECL